MINSKLIKESTDRKPAFWLKHLVNEENNAEVHKRTRETESLHSSAFYLQDKWDQAP